MVQLAGRGMKGEGTCAIHATLGLTARNEFRVAGFQVRIFPEEFPGGKPWTTYGPTRNAFRKFDPLAPKQQRRGGRPCGVGAPEGR